jgi:hypothetical protein
MEFEDLKKMYPNIEECRINTTISHIVALLKEDGWRKEPQKYILQEVKKKLK